LQQDIANGFDAAGNGVMTGCVGALDVCALKIQRSRYSTVSGVRTAVAPHPSLSTCHLWRSFDGTKGFTEAILRTNHPSLAT